MLYVKTNKHTEIIQFVCNKECLKSYLVLIVNIIYSILLVSVHFYKKENIKTPFLMFSLNVNPIFFHPQSTHYWGPPLHTNACYWRWPSFGIFNAHLLQNGEECFNGIKYILYSFYISTAVLFLRYVFGCIGSVLTTITFLFDCPKLWHNKFLNCYCYLN